MKSRRFIVLLTAALAFSAFAANTWYVDAENGVDATGRGTSEGNAFLTLQYAHDQASAGDTIIAAPGNYDQGYGLAAGHAHTNRLCVTQALHFVSSTPKAAHIVGAFDPETGADGTNACRCVCVTDKGYGTSFAGFTFRNGASNPVGSGSPNGDWAAAQGSSIANGGGLLVFGNRTTSKTAAIYKVYLTDCVISNCVSKWGAAMHGGTAIRCFFAHNTGTSFGQTVTGAALWNTVIYDTTSRDARPVVGNHCTLVNCTVVGGSYGNGRNGKAYNTVFSELTNKALYTDSYTPTHTNCLDQVACARPFANPLFGDWRVISEVPGAETGSMSDLTDRILLPPGTAMTDFNGTPIDTNREHCTIGAVQELAVNASGTLTVPAGTMVDGVLARRQAHLRAVGDYPRFFALRPVAEKFMRYERSNAFGGPKYLYADYKGKCVVVPPPFADENCTLTEKVYEHAYWCSPEADAATADGTAAHPYRTIQAAVDAGKAQYERDGGKIFVINCLPGTYAEGSRDGEDHHNRVVIPDYCPCLIRSTGGAAVTTIKGEADPNPPMPNAYIGCGTNAMRCVYAAGSQNGQCAIQGFTFADGHSSCSNYSVDAHSDRVGGVYCKGSRETMTVLDSVFTNCTAVRGGAVYYGNLRRCQFYDCISFGGVMRYGTLVSSYVDPTCVLGKGGTGASLNCVVGTEMYALNVTQPGNTEFGGIWNYCSLWGRIYCSSKPQYGTVYTPQWNGVSSLGSGGAAQGEVFWADEATHGVGAVYSASPALHAVEYPQRGTPEWGAFASNVCANADSDLYGEVPQLKNGRLVPGANIAAVDSVHVPPNAGIAVAGATPDAQGVIEVSSPDFAVTVSAAATGTRPCVGFTANGVTNLFPLATPYAISYADVVAEGGIALAGIFSPHWYVNADPAIGNDANSGFTPDVPKRTLAAVMSVPGMASGDTVHAAAGVYNEGSMEWEKGGNTTFRVAVKGGVTLVGDEGADKTFIVGAPDPAEQANAANPGLGPNAMHCVYLNVLATIRGFTLTGGYTDVYDLRYTSDWVVPVTGGGLCGNDKGRDNAYMYDCIVSNNYAYTGGGTRWVNAVNCRITDNHALYDGGNTRECNLWGTYVNRGFQGTKDSASGNYNISRNAYCTFGPDNWWYNGVTPNLAINGASSGIASISNCVVMGVCGSASAMTNLAYNTVFAKGKGALDIDAGSCVVRPDGMPGQFDAEGRPLPGCPAVDRGDRDNLPTLLRGIDHDASGFQRIMNGAIDVGALEGDWRARYAADCATTRRFSVTAASSEVKEEEGVVTLHSGDTLEAQFENPQQRSTPCAVTVRLAGTGALLVKLNGEVLQEVTAIGETTLKFVNTLALNDLDFAYTGEGTAALVSVERMTGVRINFR